MPLGGIGAGFLLVNKRGCLYNHVPGSGSYKGYLPNTFPCIRIQKGNAPPYIRVLRESVEDDQPVENIDFPPCLKQGQYSHEFYYPRAAFRMRESEAPLTISWSYTNPVIPYDHVASALPVVLIEICIENTTPDPVNVTVLFVADNISVQDAAASSEKAGLVHAVRTSSDEDTNGNFKRNVFRGVMANLTPEMVRQYEFNGLVFGERRKSDDGDPQFNACLAAKEQHAADIVISEYNPASQVNTQRFWRGFVTSGKVPVPGLPSMMRAGVISVSRDVPAGSTQRFNYAFSWHMPEYLAEEKGYSSGGYSFRFKSSQDTAHHVLKHLTYLSNAVEKWQRKMLVPQMPANYGAAVLHASRIFSIHTRHTPKGGFILRDDNAVQERSLCSWDFLAGRGLLVFAPHFHTQAVTVCLANTAAMLDRGHCQDTPEALCAVAGLFLSAYADALFLGHRARMTQWLHSMYAIADALFKRPLSEYAASGELLSRFTLRGMGLWVGALTVLAAMAREMGDTGASEKYQKLAGIFGVRYDTELLKALSIIDGPKSSTKKATEDAISCDDFLALEGSCCLSLLGIEPTSALKKILMLVMTRVESMPICEYHGSGDFRSCVLSVLIHLLYKKRGGLGKEDADTLLKCLVDKYGASISEMAARGTFPPVGMLSLWAVLQAMTGFYYDGFHQTLYLRPTIIPKENLQLPLFTPLSLGDIAIKKEDGEERSLTIRFSMGTPLTIRSVIVLLPMTMESVRVKCVSDSEKIGVQQEISGDEYTTRLVLTFKSPLKMADTFSLRLIEQRLAGNGNQ